MDINYILELFELAQEAGYCVRLKLNNGQSMILQPALGAIETVEINGQSFIKLKKSLLPVSNINRAILYGDD